MFVPHAIAVSNQEEYTLAPCVLHFYGVGIKKINKIEKYLEIILGILYIPTIMPLTEAQKRAKKNWIEKNKEFHNALQNMYAKSYYEKNRDVCREKALARYYSKKQFKEEEGDPSPEV